MVRTEVAVPRTLILAIPLLVFLASCGADSSSKATADTSNAVVTDEVPFARLPGGESGPGSGSWLGERGMFEPYRDGHLFAVAFRVKNRSAEPLTLLSATQEQDGHRLLRMVGVRFTLAEESQGGDVFSTGLLSPEAGAEPAALLVPPDREAYVQFDFRMGECEFFDPGEQVRYNEQATFRYSVDGQQASALVDLTGLTVTITAPAKKDCPHAT
jgi:hypothetical protein